MSDFSNKYDIDIFCSLMSKNYNPYRMLVLFTHTWILNIIWQTTVQFITLRWTRPHIVETTRYTLRRMACRTKNSPSPDYNKVPVKSTLVFVNTWVFLTRCMYMSKEDMPITVSASMQLAQCRFPAWLAISNAKILIYFSNKIYGSNFTIQHSDTVMVWNYQNDDCSLRKKNYLLEFPAHFRFL